MNFGAVRALITEGINISSDSQGVFTMENSSGGVTIINGQEVYYPTANVQIKGLVRDINRRDIDGEYIKFGDKRGIFTADVVIEFGYKITIDGEKYTVVDPRPVKPTGTVIAYRPILRRVALYG